MNEVLCPYCGGEMRRVMTIWSDGEWYECKDCGSRSPVVRPSNYDDALKAALARESVPVVHGRWMINEYGNTTCSACGCELPGFHCYDEETDEEWDEQIDDTLYCPNCGAKMAGGAE